MTEESPSDPIPRRTIYFELLVTVGLLAIPSTIQGLYLLAHPGADLHATDNAPWNFAFGLIQELLLIGLVIHILHLHRERLDTLSPDPKKIDAAWAVALLIGGWIAIAATLRASQTLFHGTNVEPQNVDLFQARLSPLYFALMIVNPFAEELIVRGFLQTRLRQAGWPSAAIVLISVGVQTAYHVYQGLPSALALGAGFLIWAIFYQATRRLWPVVGAHLIMDVVAMLQMAQSGPAGR